MILYPKLADTFKMSDWVCGIPDVRNALEAYLDREVASVAPVKLDGCGDDVVIAMRVYVEQKKGDEDVRNKGVRKVEDLLVEGGVPEVPDGLDREYGRGREGQGGGRAVEPGGGDQHDGHGQMKTMREMILGPAVTDRDGGAFDLTEIIKSTVEARIKKGNLVPAFQGCWGMGNYEKTLRGLCDICRPYVAIASRLEKYGGSV